MINITKLSCCVCIWIANSYNVNNILPLLYILDVHVISVIKAEENYENIAQGMKGSLSSINRLISDPYIIIEEETYEVEIFLCCDYKVISYLI